MIKWFRILGPKGEKRSEWLRLDEFPGLIVHHDETLLIAKSKHVRAGCYANYGQ